MENTNSIKGKGLEGDFVYGWDGKELILIPTSAPDYIQMTQYNEILFQKNHIKVKDLVLGGIYKTKTNEEWIYMGKFDYYENKYGHYKNGDYEKININKGKYHYFVNEGKYGLNILTLKSLGEKFIATISTNCVENYADLFDKLEYNSHYSPYDVSKDEYIQYTFEEFYNILNNETWFYCYDWQKIRHRINKSYNKKDHWVVKLQQYVNDFNFYNKNILEGTIEEVYNKLQPMYKKEYLKNGKFYRNN